MPFVVYGAGGVGELVLPLNIILPQSDTHPPTFRGALANFQLDQLIDTNSYTFGHMLE